MVWVVEQGGLFASYQITLRASVMLHGCAKAKMKEGSMKKSIGFNLSDEKVEDAGQIQAV